MRMEVVIKEYPKEAKSLVGIWTNYANGTLPKAEIDYVTFKNKRPKNPKTQNRRIAGLRAESICYLKGDEELVKMSVENFMYLMAKCGVVFEMKEVE